MILPSTRVDSSPEIHLQKINKLSAAYEIQKPTRRDAAMISKFSTLVEHGRASALALPEIRADKVAQARALLDAGSLPGASNIASAMINAAVEGVV